MERQARILNLFITSVRMALGSVKLVYAGSAIETTLPQALSVDGGRYTHGDVEFWIKGNGATLTRAGKSTTCGTRS
ncbi:hypothetical protein MAE02_54040 [Microvirga aerophila]|uniref:C-type lysozyme inhibitor domain-containing protein n=2 Tax=Microvirga aerophila TaxID=670291 RepID=A0A512C0G4_9HYPH|nr:hypothetical protein MAE02_54040 [Microvirga aerophila]